MSKHYSAFRALQPAAFGEANLAFKIQDSAAACSYSLDSELAFQHTGCSTEFMGFAFGFRISRSRKLNKRRCGSNRYLARASSARRLDDCRKSHLSRLAFGGTSESERFDPGSLFPCQDVDIAYVVLNQQPPASERAPNDLGALIHESKLL